MMRLAFAQLRHRGMRYVSLFFAVFAAVMLTVSTVSIVESLQKTVNSTFDKPYRAATYVGEIHDAKQSDLNGIEGDPEIAFDQVIQGSIQDEGTLYRSTYIKSIQQGPLQWRTVLEGRLPVGENEIVTVDDTPVGSQLNVNVPRSESRTSEEVLVTVVGRVERSAEEQLLGVSAIFADSQAVQLWAANNINGELRIASTLTKEQVADQLSFIAPNGLISGDQRASDLADRYLSGRDKYFLLLTAFMFVVAIVAMLVIFSAYSVLANERRREYALLRAVGASSAQLLVATATEALTIGFTASALAVPIGVRAAGLAGKNAHRIGVKVPLEEVSISTSWLVLIVGVAILVSLASALPAARGVVKLPLVQSLSTSEAKPRTGRLFASLIMGCTLGAVGVSGLVLTPHFTAKRSLALSIASAGLIVLSLTLLSAVLLPWLIFQISRISGGIPIPHFHLGMAFVGRQRLRAGSLIAIVLAGTALVSAVVHGQRQVSDHLVSRSAENGAVDIVLRSMDGSVSSELSEELRNTPGVAAVAQPPFVPLSTSTEQTEEMFALSTQEGSQVLRGTTQGALPGELVLGRDSHLKSVLPDGKISQINILGSMREARVKHSSGVESFVDPGIIPSTPKALPRPALLLRIDGDPAQSQDSPAVQSVRKTAAESGERLSFNESFSARKDAIDAAARLLTLSSLMSIVALLIAGVGVLNTVTIMVRERTRDIKLLNSIGLSSWGRIEIQLVELLFLVVPAAVVGSCSGAVLGVRISSVLTQTLRPALSTVLLNSVNLKVVIGAAAIAVAVTLFVVAAERVRKTA